MTGSLLAGAAGALVAIGAVLVMPRSVELPGPLRSVGMRVGQELTRTTELLRELGSARAPLPRGRVRRLRVTAAAAGAVCGGVVLGMRGSLLVAIAAGWIAPRLIEVRRERYGRRLDEGCPAAAFALADAVSGGASLRASVAIAARRVRGPIAGELSRTAWELEMGAATEAALERLRTRSVSRAVTLIVAAMQVQRRSGGDLPRVLRDVGTALEQERRVLEEARAATAQARFTAVVVIALPVCGIALGALASPGLVGRMTATPVGIGLLVAALALQVSGAVLIRRLAGTFA